ncbi:phage baseplate upper protein [Brochothrix campestris]|uniref:Muramidase n=1 Tax=Brochothrix campestris FSL F6-1037 TaxID=1265861 RepID=W7CYF2_9LIST|nr:phage baseplate upper protein [Brochothrix campestris]EUJ41982.1 muramidase [Brochothrix campestris FSL F6-1037]
MTIYQFNLSTTEPNNSIGLIRVRQDDDESQIFKVTIYENGSPKNLTGVFAEFNMVDAKDHVIVDEAYITDGPNGLVEYHLNKAAMQSVGRCKAYFSFKNEDDVLFSTKDFSYNVIWSALSHPLHHGCDYVWTIADLIENLKDYIEHAMGDFDDWFESVKDILASIDPGGVILKELLDARHSTPFDMKHSTLKERLDYTDALVKRLEELENSFDLATLEPMFVSNLATRRNAVLQAFCIDTKTSQYYAAQSDSQTPEGFVISQISPAGSKLLSTMNFPNSGHGTTFGMEREKDTIYIWTITNNCADEQRLIRVPYVKNSTLDYSTDLKDYTPASLKNIYFTPVVDMLHNTMLIRRGDGLCELRHLDDIKNGIDKVLYSVQVPITENNDDRPMQGAVSHGTTLYWYSGWSTNAVKVFKYDMVSKKLLITREFEFPNETGNGFTDDYREPEGLAYYINPYTGKESLLMGITSGDSIKRYQMIYAIHQRGAQEHFDSLRALESQNYAYFRGDGRAHGIPTGLTKLSDLRRTGVYYLTAEMGALLTDLPSPQFKKCWNLCRK